MVGCVQRRIDNEKGHLETAPPLTFPCEGREAGFLHRLNRESNPGALRGSALHKMIETISIFAGNSGCQREI